MPNSDVTVAIAELRSALEREADSGQNMRAFPLVLAALEALAGEDAEGELPELQLEAEPQGLLVNLTVKGGVGWSQVVWGDGSEGPTNSEGLAQHQYGRADTYTIRATDGTLHGATEVKPESDPQKSTALTTAGSAAPVASGPGAVTPQTTSTVAADAPQKLAEGDTMQEASAVQEGPTPPQPTPPEPAEEPQDESPQSAPDAPAAIPSSDELDAAAHSSSSSEAT